MADLWSVARQVTGELEALDRAVYVAVHATPSPTLDRAVAGLSRSADHSLLWLAVAAALGSRAGRRRRATWVGLAALGVTSATVNVLVKPLARRGRPLRDDTVRTHLVQMPRSTSYPSGHAASAFAFSTAVGGGLPETDPALRLLATVVAYSRVHTGVHYPADVIAGAVIGASIGSLARHSAHRAGFLQQRTRPAGAGVP